MMLQKTLNPNRHEMYAFGYINVDFLKIEWLKRFVSCQLNFRLFVSCQLNSY